MSDDLARLDATAQAELVRDGEADPGRAGRSRDRADRGDQRRDQRGDPPALRGGAGGGSRRAARRALQGRALPAQGPRRGLRRPAAPPRHELPQGTRFPRPGRHLPGAALPRRRAGHDRQDELPRAGHPADHRAARLRRDAQPLGPRAHAGRLERRLCRRGRRRDGADGARQRRRRLDPHPGLQLRPRRPQAEPAADQRGADRRRLHVGPDRELCVSRSVRDTAALLEAVHGPAPGDPYVAPAAAPSLHRGARRRSRQAADRAVDRDDHRAGRRPRGRRGGAGRREDAGRPRPQGRGAGPEHAEEHPDHRALPGPLGRRAGARPSISSASSAERRSVPRTSSR